MKNIEIVLKNRIMKNVKNNSLKKNNNDGIGNSIQKSTRNIFKKKE
jgi:hypothetical protein